MKKLNYLNVLPSVKVWSCFVINNRKKTTSQTIISNRCNFVAYNVNRARMYLVIKLLNEYQYCSGVRNMCVKCQHMSSNMVFNMNTFTTHTPNLRQKMENIEIFIHFTFAFAFAIFIAYNLICQVNSSGVQAHKASKKIQNKSRS